MPTICLNQLATVEVQLIMHGLDIHSLFNLSKCNKYLRIVAAQAFAWKIAPPFRISTDRFSKMTQKLQSIPSKIPLMYMSLHLTVEDDCQKSKDDEVALSKIIMKYIQNNMRVTHITLDNCGVHSKTINDWTDVIKCNINMMYINFKNNNIRNQGAILLSEAIKFCKNLTSINLCSNDIGDEGAIALFNSIKNNNKYMTDVYIGDNLITKTGAIAIAEAVKFITSLKTLNFHSNEIEDEGVIALANAIKESRNITSIDFGNNLITEIGVAAVAEAIKSIKFMNNLKLDRNRIGNKGILIIAGLLSNLDIKITNLNVSHNTFYRQTGMKTLAYSLRYNNSTQSISLGRCNIDNVGVNYLADAIRYNKGLTSLDLSRNNFGELGISKLVDAIKINSHLTRIDLSWNADYQSALQITDCLKHHKSLLTLKLV